MGQLERQNLSGGMRVVGKYEMTQTGGCEMIEKKVYNKKCSSNQETALGGLYSSLAEEHVFINVTCSIEGHPGTG